MKLAILLYGLESERPELNEVMKKLQKQLNDAGSDDLEVVFYTDNGELSIEEKKDWLLGQTTAPKYVFVNAQSEIEENFAIRRLGAIKAHASSIKLLELGVFIKEKQINKA